MQIRRKFDRDVIISANNSGGRIWRVCVRPKTPQLDGHGRKVLAEIRQIGLDHVEAVLSSKEYFFKGSLLESDIRMISEELLCDPVAESFEYSEAADPVTMSSPLVEVIPLPGVMNPVAMSVRDSVRRLLRSTGQKENRLTDVQTARRYAIVGARNHAELDRIAGKILANDCIEAWWIHAPGRKYQGLEVFPHPVEHPFQVRRLPLLSLSDGELTRLSRDGHLFLSLTEMQAIRAYFASLGREPTDLELETFAQTWSEHCVHKTLKSEIEYEGQDFGRPGSVRVRFENLLKDTIALATKTLNRPWCLSVFVDNAGIVAFDDDFGIAFKVETHNHPSAIEPYGGAATGVGGCIRDIMGCGLGAKPIASTDVFCLAPPDFDQSRLPKGVLHPLRVLKGVVGGVRDYGNRMGIPTVNGAIYFDERYLANPLVYCGCVGLIPKDRIHKEPRAGDLIIVAGGRTGRDGIHGATFSSAELTDTHADEFSHAVQIGNAIEEKKLLDALLIARDHPDGCLYSAITDCGAGGLSSAVGEMAAKLGAIVDLEKVPLKYAGLRYDEIWISEAQERMVFAVPSRSIEKFLAVYAAEEVEATVIGQFTDNGLLSVRFRGQTVGEINLHFLHEGLPKTTRKARWNGLETGNPRPQPRNADTRSIKELLLAELGSFNVASKEWVIRQYDHEVQGRSVIKPLVGRGSGPSDAAVLRPRLDSYGGIALGCGLCPQQTQVDPYWMAVRAIDEAFRNVICVGADPDRVAILDNFCWPKCESEESLGELVRACRGACDAAIAYGLPFISGKDSLNNEFALSEEEAARLQLPRRLLIPGTLLISALGIVEDVRQCVSMDFKEAGNAIVLASAPVEQQGLEAAISLHRRVASMIRNGKVWSAHDISDGGLAVALSEMCIAGKIGAEIVLPSAFEDGALFQDIPTSYLLEMSQQDVEKTNWPVVGKVREGTTLSMESQTFSGVHADLHELNEAWNAPLRQGGG